MFGHHSQEAFEPRESIWAVLEANSLKEERPEMKTMIGGSLIEETQDLHEEVKTLLEIWRSYRGDTDSIKQCKGLPDPPNMRENLVRQIQMFVKLLQEKTSKENRDITRVLSANQSSIVKKISTENDGRNDHALQRPSTALSHTDRQQTPIRPSSAASGRDSSSGTRLNDQFSTGSKQNDLSEIERLADTIREEIEQERIGLHSDIDFLQQCLMDESSYRQSVSRTTQEPSIQDLKDIGLKLEKELLQKDNGTEDKTTKALPSNIRPEKRVQSSPSKTSATVHHRIVPSPPSSAPTNKVRSHANHRKQLFAKTFSFPSESGSTGGDNEVLVTSRPHALPTIMKPTASASVAAPCIQNTSGSNSRRLRDMVFKSRDQP